jgi:signal transduction histidine kinase
MSTAMRTRTRLVLGFVGVHLILSVALGWTAWRWLDGSMRAQAEYSARSVGQVLAQGHFPLTPEVIAKMRTLTGYQFRVLDARTEPLPGTVQVAEAGKVIEIDYRTATYLRWSHAVLLGTLALILAGAAVFGAVAAWLAGQFAQPLERLAGAARIIGSGDLDAAVPEAGSGEIRQLARELEHMRQRLRDLDRQHRQAERLASIGTFTATIAHEVRNPLSAVRLTVQLLARKLGDDPSLALIMDELERLDLIVDELLGFSKGMTATCESCDLRPVAEGVIRLLRRQADHAGVTVMVEGAATVRADPARLRQLLMNLLLNAIQAQHVRAAGAGGGAVRVVIAADGFSVSDDGPGVDPALVPRLFEPFASGRPDGTGLGLHLARAIAEAHGAKLAYAPQAKGARFVLSGLVPA